MVFYTISGEIFNLIIMRTALNDCHTPQTDAPRLTRKTLYYGQQHGKQPLDKDGIHLIKIKCGSDAENCYAKLEGGKVNVSQHANLHDDDARPTLINRDGAAHTEPCPGDSLLLPGCGCHFYVKNGEIQPLGDCQVERLLDVFDE